MSLNLKKKSMLRSDDNPQEMEHIAHVEIEIPGLDRDLFPDGGSYSFSLSKS